MNAPHGRPAGDPAPDPAAPPSGSDAGRPCGCQQRQEALNEWIPGLGDAVKVVADPVYERWNAMPAILRPDMKSLVWLAIGAFVVPRILGAVR